MQGAMSAIHWQPVLEVLVLVVWANAVPVLLRLFLGTRLGAPVDGGLVLRDGRPLFGASKTWRGIAGSLVSTPFGAFLLGMPWTLGLGVAIGAMAGDLVASFVKRRLGLAASGSLPVVDQVPESLLPALIAAGPRGLDAVEIALIVVAFAVIDIWLTPLAKRLRARFKQR